MGRKPQVGLSFFPHDTNASNDMKLQYLVADCGLAGLGFYWFHIERIYQQNSFSLDISDPVTIQILCRYLAINEQEYDRYLSICLKYELFDKKLCTDKKLLTSNGIQKRGKLVTSKRVSAAKSKGYGLDTNNNGSNGDTDE
jgi:hypothetical protein